MLDCNTPLARGKWSKLGIAHEYVKFQISNPKRNGGKRQEAEGKMREKSEVGKRLEMRPLKARDYPAVVEIYRQTPRFIVELNGRPTESIGLEMVEEDAAQAANHGATFAGLFSRDSGTLIGVTDYVPSGHKGRPSQAWIALLMITEPHQRQGYGTEAYQLIEDTILADPGVQTISLGVLVNNGPALGFWAAMGYQRVGSTVTDKDGREVVILQKQRTEPVRPDVARGDDGIE
jgi:RimJ/RimL family protein N-acetyltransferase